MTVLTVAENDFRLVFVEETLGSGQIVPIQRMWSNAPGVPGELF